MNIHSCLLLLWHSQDLGPRSLLAVLPPPTSTEKTIQRPRPTVLAVLPTPPPPTTQGPRLPGGKDARSSRCCHHHHHHPPREKNHPRNVKDGYILRWVYLDLRISHVRSRALMTIANQVGCNSLNSFSHFMTALASSSLSGFLSGCHARAACRYHLSNGISCDVASRCHLLISAMTASKAESRPFSRGG